MKLERVLTWHQCIFLEWLVETIEWFQPRDWEKSVDVDMFEKVVETLSGYFQL